MKNILIIGATSAIAQAVSRIYAADGNRLYLVARNGEKLGAVVEDLRTRGADTVISCELDVLDYDRHRTVIEDADDRLGALDVALIAHGTLPDQKACELSADMTMNEIEINLLGTVSMLTHLANYFEKRNTGSIAVISSVAGERGRQSNYVYGTAKAGVSVFLQGLRNRLHQTGVNVLTVKPGFVITPMTAAFSKGILWAEPEAVAKSIVHAISSNKNTIYTPWYWKWIMLVIRLIPEFIFKRLQL